METILKEPEAEMETFYAKPRLRKERTKIVEYNPMSDPVQVITLVLASYYGLTIDDICVPCRKRGVKHIRQSVQTILSRKGKLHLCVIGRITNRCHATILNSIKCVSDDEFVCKRQGISSPLLDVYNALDNKFNKLFIPKKYIK